MKKTPEIPEEAKIFLQQSREKFLSQVFRLCRIMSLTPDVGIQGRPIGAAQVSHRLAGLRRVFRLGGEDHAPMRRDKASLATVAVGRNIGVRSGHGCDHGRASAFLARSKCDPAPTLSKSHGELTILFYPPTVIRKSCQPIQIRLNFSAVNFLKNT